MATPICKQCTTFGHVDIQCPAKGIWVPKTTLTPEGGEENEQGKKTNAEFKGKQVNGDAKENDDDTSEIDSGGGEVVEEVPDRGKESEMGESSKQEPEQTGEVASDTGSQNGEQGVYDTKDHNQEKADTGYQEPNMDGQDEERVKAIEKEGRGPAERKIV